MTPTSPVPPYPTPLGMLKGKTVVVTAAAGTALMRTPCSAASIAAQRVKAMTPAFAAA